jgi:hypothetical protein
MASRGYCCEDGFFCHERGDTKREVLYLLLDLSGCEFQPYQVATQ